MRARGSAAFVLYRSRRTEALPLEERVQCTKLPVRADLYMLEGVVMGKLIVYERPDGQSVNGYLAEPSQNRIAPGVVVIQEWWGLNDQIKSVADKLVAAVRAKLSQSRVGCAERFVTISTISPLFSS